MPNFFESSLAIAEVAQSYEGSFDLVASSIDAAAGMGATLINFQVFLADELAVPSYEYFDLYRSLELSSSQWQQLFQRAHEQGVKVVANVFGSQTAEELSDAGIDAFKIHAADTANLPFLRRLAKLGKPILLSTGGSTFAEVNRAIGVLQEEENLELALILGVQNTPTALEDTNLARIRVIKERFGLPVGYADHVDAEKPLAKIAPLLALAAGADFVEKHFTLDRSLKREDYISSLNPDEFAEMVVRLNETRQTMGIPGGDMGEGELDYREGMKKRVVARTDLSARSTLTYENLDLLRTDVSSDLWSLESTVGRVISKPLAKHEVVMSNDLSEKTGAQKRVVAVLLCRAVSSRLYAKPLQVVGDKTILEHLISQIRLVSQVHDIILAISEDRESKGFVEVANRLELDYVFGDEVDGLGRMLRAADYADADVVFRVTTENPFLYLDNLPELIDTHFKEGADLTVCENLPEGAYAEIIEVSALERSHREGDDKHRSAWVSSYIFENPDKFKVVKTLPPPELRRPDIRLTVDYPEDLIVMRKIHDAFEGKMPIPMASIIAFLDEHPEIKAINGNIEAGAGRIWN